MGKIVKTTKRKTSQQKAGYHHGNLRPAIIKEALKIVAKQGSDSLSLRTVAKNLGVSHGAPYRHFADKEELLAAIAEEGFRIFADHLRIAREETEGDLMDKFIAMGFCYLKFAREYDHHFRLMFTNTIPDHQQYENLNEAGNRAFKILTDMIAIFVAEGLIETDSIERTSVGVMCGVHGLCMMQIEDRLCFLEYDTPEDYGKLLTHMLKQNLFGILSEKGKSRFQKDSHF